MILVREPKICNLYEAYPYAGHRAKNIPLSAWYAGAFKELKLNC